MSAAADKKRRQRERWRAEGWELVSVRIPASRRAEFDAFVASLGEPEPAAAPGQQALFPHLDPPSPATA